MLKRKFMSLFVPVIAFATIVGVGYSAWVFNAQTQQEFGVGVNVVHAHDGFGAFASATHDYKLELDQGGNLTSKTVGISMYDGDEKVTKIDTTWTVSSCQYNDVDSANIKYYANIYVKSATLGQYVTLNGVTAADENTKYLSSTYGSADYTIYQKELTPAEAPVVDTTNATVNLSLSVASLFNYKDNKPTTFEEYQEMVKTLGAVTAAADVQQGQAYSVAASTKSLVIEFVAAYEAPVTAD